MNTRQLLEERELRIQKVGSGRYIVSALFYGKRRYATINNSMIYDAMTSCEPFSQERGCGYTFKQAADYCMRELRR